MAFKMRSGNKTPFKLMGAKDAPMKMMKKSPSKLMKKSPAEFNPGLKKAAADGKLDNNPKFKAAVEGAPAKMMKKSAAKMMKKDSAAKLMKRPKDKKSPGEDRVKDIKKTNEAGVGTGKGMKVDKKNRKRDIAESPKPGLKVDKKNRKQSPSKMAKKSPNKMAKESPAKIIPGLKKRGTKGTKFVDKVKALGEGVKKAIDVGTYGSASGAIGSGIREYKHSKAIYRRERAAKEAAKNKKSGAKMKKDPAMKMKKKDAAMKMKKAPAKMMKKK
tara:strand:- start:42 stop:857 length:816 start_codon:yes stop_codon:yes gene_type:complete